MRKILFIFALLPLFLNAQTKRLDNAPNANTFKAHITTEFAVESTLNWNNFKGYTDVTEESAGKIAYVLNDSCIVIERDGLYVFGGCVHYKDNSGLGITDLTIFTRINVNLNDEARCSQRGKVQNLRGNGRDMLSFSGTAMLKSGDCVYLQYYTNNATLTFFSSPVFDKQVATSIWFDFIGQ